MLDHQNLDHSRRWHAHRYVYAVASRRAQGISIGINLNVDMICNFGCVYCEVLRGVVPATRLVDREVVLAELRLMLEEAANGRLARDERFAGLTPDGALLPVRDIAFSGDGEPTSFRNFAEVVADVIALRDALGMHALKIVVITNASLFHRPRVQQALQAVYEAGGEVWAKLDAGTAEYFREVDATRIPYARILSNIASLAQTQPLVIQSCFMRLHGQGPDQREIAAYRDRLRAIVADGGQIARVQVYTVSRPPAERYVTSLTSVELEAIRQVVAEGLPDIVVERYDGAWDGDAAAD